MAELVVFRSTEVFSAHARPDMADRRAAIRYYLDVEMSDKFIFGTFSETESRQLQNEGFPNGTSIMKLNNLRKKLAPKH